MTEPPPHPPVAGAAARIAEHPRAAGWRVFYSSLARKRLFRLFINWSMSSLFPILRLPYITTNSALGRPNLWLSSESSLCLLMNILWSIILESVLFRICAGAGGCANGYYIPNLSPVSAYSTSTLRFSVLPVSAYLNILTAIFIK